MSTASADEKGIITACSQCGQKNRLPYEKLGKVGTCGKCKSDLQSPSVPVEVSQESIFDLLVRTSPLPVVVDYWAAWCGPCRQVAPELEKVAAANVGKFIVAKVNTEVVPSLSQRYQINSIPTMAVFSGGREVGRTSGARPAAGIEAFIQSSLKN